MKKAYRFLSKKIETIQKDLKLAEENLSSQRNKEDPFIMRSTINTDCLACGQEITKSRGKSETRSWNKLPTHSLKVVNK